MSTSVSELPPLILSLSKDTRQSQPRSLANVVAILRQAQGERVLLS